MSTLTAPQVILNWREAEDRFGRLVDAFLTGSPAPEIGIVTVPLLTRARNEADRLMDVALDLRDARA